MALRPVTCRKSLGRRFAIFFPLVVASNWLTDIQRTAAEDPPAAEQQDIADGALWLSPTRGGPAELHWVPAGGQCFVFVRVADLRQSDAGRRAIDALGPRFDAALERWQKTTGVQLADVDRLLLTFIPSAEGPVAVVATIWLIDPASAAGSFGQLVGDGVLVCGPPPLINEVAESAGQPALLRRQMNTLRKTTDEDRHVTILLTPSFLLRETGALFSGDLAALKPSLERLLTEDTQAAAASLHVNDTECYAELRLLMTLERRRAVQRQFFAQLKQSLGESQQRLTALGTVGPHWSRLADRLPKMLELTRNQLRFSWERDQAVLNLSLPAAAAHNLVLAAELLLAADPSDGDSADPPEVLSITEALKLRLEFSFAQLSFDEAFQGLIREVNAIAPNADLKIRVDGGPLKEAGVTRNQELTAFAPGERTFAQLLTLLAMRANPSKVRHPSELGQLVIWTIERSPENPDKQVLLVTTRQAAEKNGYPLPRYFRKK